jgi:hypothetical protein
MRSNKESLPNVVDFLSKTKESLLKPISYLRQLREKQGSWIPLVVVSSIATFITGLAAATLYEPKTVEATLPALVTTLVGYTAYLYTRPSDYKF